MRVHTLEPARDTLHGLFSRDLPPAITIDSGDTVVLRTLDAGWGMEPPTERGATPRRFDDVRPEWKGDGHALCGPIAVNGAAPGMTLEVRINDLQPGTWGWTAGGGPFSALNKRLGVDDREEPLHWELDSTRLTARDQHGHTVLLRPFLGVIGMPPDEPGNHPTSPPRSTGGNLDCKELVVGSSLFLPIAVAGGLLSVGDGHGAQGDGEAGGTAIECAMDHVELTVVVHDNARLGTPHARTPAGWITFGLNEDLNEAMTAALDQMLALMCQVLAVSRYQAIALASVAVDLRVTQVANGVWGIHALLPHGAIR